MDKDNKNSDTTKTESPSVIETDSLETPADGVQSTTDQSAAVAPKKPKAGIKKVLGRFNIYLLLFILVLVVSGAVVIITALSQRTSGDDTKIVGQSVPSDVLKQLSKTDATVGDPKQVLSVQSNAVFAGKVLIRDSLDVAGPININGALTLPGITVSGDSRFDQVQVNKTLSIGGDASLLGQLNVKKGLSVSGGGTFGGPVTAPVIATNSLQLLGDLTLSSHIVTAGPSPDRSNGGAIGGGGTTSVNGSDMAGSININTGSGPAAGCFITVNFSRKFNTTPHVVITPNSSAAASLDYYVMRSTSSFSVCTVSTPPAGSSFGFDYIVVG